MPVSLCLKDFLAYPGLILDVRSPSEYQQGHLPTSFSFPLFTNEERALLGTLYKRQGRQEAIEMGLEIVQPKLPQFIHQAATLLNQSVKVLCWRGGMRSGFIAHLLESIGYSVATLRGGYKAFRQEVHRLFRRFPNSHPKLIILGGFTGCGKTDILQSLRQMGEQVVDLEQLANHRGSAFGGIDLPQQPTQEHFENQLAGCLEQLDLTRPIWMEDEGRLIGKCHLPRELYQAMQRAPLFCLERPQEERIAQLMRLYGQAALGDLLDAIQRLSKRLGNQLTKELREDLESGRKREAIRRLLIYYDKAYHYQLEKRPLVHCLQSPHQSADEWALYLKKAVKQATSL